MPQWARIGWVIICVGLAALYGWMGLQYQPMRRVHLAFSGVFVGLAVLWAVRALLVARS